MPGHQLERPQRENKNLQNLIGLGPGIVYLPIYGRTVPAREYLGQISVSVSRCAEQDGTGTFVGNYNSFSSSIYTPITVSLLGYIYQLSISSRQSDWRYVCAAFHQVCWPPDSLGIIFTYPAPVWLIHFLHPPLVILSSILSVAQPGHGLMCW